MSERITDFNISFADAVVKMSDGNPGAIVALMDSTKAATIDPDSALGAWGPLLMLDGWGVYGSDIWLLYSDICNRSALHMIAVIRAVQMGFMDREELLTAIRNSRNGNSAFANYAQLEAILSDVRAALPNFGAAVPA